MRFDANNSDAWLTKLTLAAVIKPSGAFWSRPELRAFVSAFHWMGEPGYYSPNGVGSGEDWSFNFGLQAETWW